MALFLTSSAIHCPSSARLTSTRSSEPSACMVHGHPASDITLRIK